MFPISKEKNVLLDRIQYLDDREAEAKASLECVRLERRQIVDQIQHGFATTGCPMTNFALVACGGVRDPEVLQQYKQFEEDIRQPFSALQKHPHTLLTVQTARCVVRNELTFARCIHLGTLVGRSVQYNVSNQLLEVAVKASYYIRSEFIHTYTGTTSTHEGLGKGEWLTLGPLRNRRCYDPMAHRTDNEYRVPYGTVFEYALCPVDPKQLEKMMGMNSVLLSEYMHRWTRIKTAHIARL